MLVVVSRCPDRGLAGGIPRPGNLLALPPRPLEARGTRGLLGSRGAAGGHEGWALSPWQELPCGWDSQPGLWPSLCPGWEPVWPQTSRFTSLVFRAFIHTMGFQPESPSMA